MLSYVYHKCTKLRCQIWVWCSFLFPCFIKDIYLLPISDTPSSPPVHQTDVDPTTASGHPSFLSIIIFLLSVGRCGKCYFVLVKLSYLCHVE